MTEHAHHHIQAKVDIKDLKKTKKEVRVEVALEEVKKAFRQELNDLRQKAQIKGFRAGKAPDSVLIQHYRQDLEGRALSSLVEQALHLISHEKNLFIVGRPEISFDGFSLEAPFVFKATFDIRPEIVVAGLESLTLKKIAVEITEKEIADELARFREHNATLSPVVEGEVVQTGHVVRIDFDGKIDDKVFKGGSAQNYTVEVGRGQLLPEFETAILGMKAGEDKKISLNFPADYFEESLRDKEAKFVIKLHEIHQKKLPDLDDEFAKDVGKKDLAELKEEVKKHLSAVREHAHRQTYEKQVLDHLIAQNDIEVPDSMVAQEKENNQASDADVLYRLKAAMLLDSLAKEKKIEVTREDLESKFQELAQYHRQPLEQIKQFYMAQKLIPYLLHQIGNQKTLDFVLANAKMI